MSARMKENSAVVTHPGRQANRKWLLLTVVVIAGALGGVLSWNRNHPATHAGSVERAHDPASVHDGVSVEVVHPEPGGLTRTSSQIGSVHPFEQADPFA